MKNHDSFTQKDISFSTNLHSCRLNIFKLRFADITAMCGVPQATMQSYDEDNIFVSPFLKTAKKLADMYCTTIDRLASYAIWFDSEEYLEMQIRFINRLGPADVSDYRDDMFTEIYKHIRLSRKDVYEMIKDTFRNIIKKACREGRYFEIKEDKEICKNFTTNYNKLITLCRIPYRKVSELCSTSTATLTRLKQGGEPTVSTLIKLSEFFNLPISKFISEDISEDPEVDLAKIIGETIVRTEGIDFLKEDPISYEEEQKELHSQYIDLEPREAKELVIKYLERVE